MRDARLMEGVSLVEKRIKYVMLEFPFQFVNNFLLRFVASFIHDVSSKKCLQ